MLTPSRPTSIWDGGSYKDDVCSFPSLSVRKIVKIIQIITMAILKTLATVAALGAVVSGYDLPDNLRRIYDSHLVHHLLQVNDE